jgi:cytochrome bd-type quinol oxidase subunit 2
MQKLSTTEMNNGIGQLLDSEKAKYEQQRARQRKFTRILAACLLPLFLGIGVISFLSLSKALSKQTFFIISSTIFVYSLIAGFLEYIKTKTNGHKKAVLGTVIQLLLFMLLSVLMINLLEK